jgi:hypothetical protein
VKATSFIFFLLYASLLSCVVLYFLSEHTLIKSLLSALGLVSALALQALASSQQKSL